jgi:RNA ligase (TIGR02306 family)
VRTDDFKPGDRAVYVPIDSIVQTTRPEFAFLAPKSKPNGTYRIRAMKLRGIFSMGLLVKTDLSYGFEWGADLSQILGVTKYEEPEVIHTGTKATSADQAAEPPGLPIPRYTDIEHLRKFQNALRPGELVLITEKVHGANARYAYRTEEIRIKPESWTERALEFFFGPRYEETGEVHLGSRKQWKKPEGAWYLALTDQMELLCQAIEPCVLMGEVYGRGIQDLTYGRDFPDFIAFDIYDPRTGEYWDFSETRRICREYGVPVVPVLHLGPFDPGLVKELAEQDSRVSLIPQISEGVVVRPFYERRGQEGRTILKWPGERYLLREEKAA